MFKNLLNNTVGFSSEIGKKSPSLDTINKHRGKKAPLADSLSLRRESETEPFDMIGYRIFILDSFFSSLKSCLPTEYVLKLRKNLQDDFYAQFVSSVFSDHGKNFEIITVADVSPLEVFPFFLYVRKFDVHNLQLLDSVDAVKCLKHNLLSNSDFTSVYHQIYALQVIRASGVLIVI